MECILHKVVMDLSLVVVLFSNVDSESILLYTSLSISVNSSYFYFLFLVPSTLKIAISFIAFLIGSSSS
jgi:hypothetical protein